MDGLVGRNCPHVACNLPPFQLPRIHVGSSQKLQTVFSARLPKKESLLIRVRLRLPGDRPCPPPGGGSSPVRTQSLFACKQRSQLRHSIGVVTCVSGGKVDTLYRIWNTHLNSSKADKTDCACHASCGVCEAAVIPRATTSINALGPLLFALSREVEPERRAHRKLEAIRLQ